MTEGEDDMERVMVSMDEACVGLERAVFKGPLRSDAKWMALALAIRATTTFLIAISAQMLDIQAELRRRR